MFIETQEDVEPVEMKFRVHPEVRDRLHSVCRQQSIRIGDWLTMVFCAVQGRDYQHLILEGQTDARQGDDES